MHTLTSKGRYLPLSVPVAMGILNATPNSFYNKGQDSDIDGLLRNAEIMLNYGASILDIGGASTKPGEPLIDATEELKRVIPIITAIRDRFPEAWLSIDTYNAVVAKNAVAAGVNIVNDISAGTIDPEMLKTVAELDVPYVAMHIQGLPETMQQNPKYNNAPSEVRRFLRQAITKCTDAGISEVIIDPGFGFGKTVEHNYDILRLLGSFKALDKPLMVGISRKSLVCRPLNISPSQALNGTTALNMVALLNGANILRVHDVKEAMETITLYQQLQ